MQNTAQLWAQRRPRFLQASPPRLTSCFCNECWGGKQLKEGGEPRSHASPRAPWCKAQGGNLERSPSHSTKQPTPGRSALLLLLAALVPQAQQWGRGGQSPALPSPPGAPRLTWRYPRPKDPRTPFTPPNPPLAAASTAGAPTCTSIPTPNPSSSSSSAPFSPPSASCGAQMRSQPTQHPARRRRADT